MAAMNMISGGGPLGGTGAPPDLASLLGAGAASANPTPDAPPTQQGDPPSIVSNMLDLASQYLQVEPDHEDKLIMQKITTQLQQLLAKDQSDADNAMSGNLNARTLRHALGG
jgi:hypothetical protein